MATFETMKFGVNENLCDDIDVDMDGDFEYYDYDPDTRGNNHLHSAAATGYESKVKALLKKGRNVEAKNYKGNTPLHLAIKTIRPSIAVVKLLLEKGADIEARDKYGLTSLCWAAKYGHKDIVKLLLERGADINAKTPDGLTPMQMVDFETVSDPVGLGKILIKFFVLRNPRATIPDDISRIADLAKFWNFCKNQLGKLLGNSNIPLRQFLLETDQNKLFGYMSDKNSGILKTLKKIQKYSLYGHIIKDQCYKAKERKRLWHRSKVVLERCDLKVFPAEIIQRIASFLTNDDLKTFLKAKPKPIPKKKFSSKRKCGNSSNLVCKKRKNNASGKKKKC